MLSSPKAARLFAIFQLCFCFSLILWVVAEPFTVEHFNTHSSLLMYQTATGRGDRFVAADKLARHAQRFSQLDSNRQSSILQEYDRLEKRAQQPFFNKVGNSFAALFWKLPAFTSAWIAFSIAISLLLLLGYAGASNAVWLLPVITLCYAIDNQMYGETPVASRDLSLLPTEEYLLTRYDHDLVNAWQLYLINEWLNKTPSSEPASFQLQVEAGEHALTVARVEDRIAYPDVVPPERATKKPLSLLGLFIGWNLLVAAAASRTRA